MTTTLGHSCQFPKQNRLCTASDYQYVFKRPKKVSSSGILFLYCKNNRGYSRLGLAIAKKQFPLAVDRNRIKRLVRESFRELKSQLTSVDIVVMARKNLLNMDNAQIRTQLDKLWDQVIRKSKVL